MDKSLVLDPAATKSDFSIFIALGKLAVVNEKGNK
jgi:hypothetical protein